MAKCVKTRCLQEAVGHWSQDFRGKGPSPCQYTDTTRKAIDSATTVLLTVLYNETSEQTSRPLLSKLSQRRQI